MKKLTNGQKIIIFASILLFLLLIGIIIVQSLRIREEADVQVAIVGEIEKKNRTLEEIFEKYAIEMVKRDTFKIEVRFPKNLYNDDGSSNKEYFYAVIKDVADYLKTTFYLIDSEKDITIRVFYYDKNSETINKDEKEDEIFPEDPEKRILFTINNNDDFYEDTDGKSFVAIEKAKIIEEKTIFIRNDEVNSLRMNRFKFSEFNKEYGEPEGVNEQGFNIYEGGDVLAKKFDKKNYTQTMIYKGKYLNNFVSRVEDGYSLEKVVEEYGEPSLGGLDRGYLGYRNDIYYFFFYDDEIVLYTYDYSSNDKFESYLREYLNDYDVAKLRMVTKAVWYYYDKDEYQLLDVTTNEETGEVLGQREILHLTYPAVGVEINIDSKDMKTKGITFYSNYFMSDFIKDKIRNGVFSISSEDYIDVVERERRMNEE